MPTPIAITTITSPQKPTTIPSELPTGTLSASEFAEILGVDKEHMKNYMRRGVNGEQLDITEVPHPVRSGYVLKFLTPSEQEKAIEVLKRHGKLP